MALSNQQSEKVWLRVSLHAVIEFPSLKDYQRWMNSGRPAINPGVGRVVETSVEGP